MASHSVGTMKFEQGPRQLSLGNADWLSESDLQPYFQVATWFGSFCWPINLNFYVGRKRQEWLGAVEILCLKPMMVAVSLPFSLDGPFVFSMFAMDMVPFLWAANVQLHKKKKNEQGKWVVVTDDHITTYLLVLLQRKHL